MVRVQNTPRRKRLKKKVRLVQAGKWLELHKGQPNLIRRYAKWYGVSRSSAALERIQLGVTIDTDIVSREKHLEIEKAELRRRRKAVREARLNPPVENDGYFWTEMAEADLDDSRTADDPDGSEDTEDLPF